MEIILFLVVAIALTVLWWGWLIVRDLSDVVASRMKKQEVDAEVKHRLKENLKPLLLMGVCSFIAYTVVSIINGIDPLYWVIVFSVMFLFLVVFLIVGPLFVGEIPFIGSIVESQYGCMLSIFIFVAVVLGISYYIFTL